MTPQLPLPTGEFRPWWRRVLERIASGKVEQEGLPALPQQGSFRSITEDPNRYSVIQQGRTEPPPDQLRPGDPLFLNPDTGQVTNQETTARLYYDPQGFLTTRKTPIPAYFGQVLPQVRDELGLVRLRQDQPLIFTADQGDLARRPGESLIDHRDRLSHGYASFRQQVVQHQRMGRGEGMVPEPTITQPIVGAQRGRTQRLGEVPPPMPPEERLRLMQAGKSTEEIAELERAVAEGRPPEPTIATVLVPGSRQIDAVTRQELLARGYGENEIDRIAVVYKTDNWWYNTGLNIRRFFAQTTRPFEETRAFGGAPFPRLFTRFVALVGGTAWNVLGHLLASARDALNVVQPLTPLWAGSRPEAFRMGELAASRRMIEMRRFIHEQWKPIAAIAQSWADGSYVRRDLEDLGIEGQELDYWEDRAEQALNPSARGRAPNPVVVQYQQEFETYLQRRSEEATTEHTELWANQVMPLMRQLQFARQNGDAELYFERHEQLRPLLLDDWRRLRPLMHSGPLDLDPTRSWSFVGEPDRKDRYLNALVNAEIQFGRELEYWEMIQIREHYEDPYVEFAGHLMFDVVNFVPGLGLIDSGVFAFATKPLMRLVKPVLAATGELIKATPLVGRAITWAGQTATHAASIKVYSHSYDLFYALANRVTRLMGRETAERSMETAVEETARAVGILREVVEDPLTEPRMLTEALRTAQQATEGMSRVQLGRAVSLSKFLKPDEWTRVLGQAISRTVNKVEDVFHAQRLARYMEEGLSRPQATARIGREAREWVLSRPRLVVSEMAEAFQNEFIKKYGRVNGQLVDNVILESLAKKFPETRAIQQLVRPTTVMGRLGRTALDFVTLSGWWRRALVTFWLALRPGWVFINYIDSSFRAIIYGHLAFGDLVDVMRGSMGTIKPDELLSAELAQQLLRRDLSRGATTVLDDILAGTWNPRFGPFSFINRELERRAAKFGEGALRPGFIRDVYRTGIDLWSGIKDGIFEYNGVIEFGLRYRLFHDRFVRTFARFSEQALEATLLRLSEQGLAPDEATLALIRQIWRWSGHDAVKMREAIARLLGKRVGGTPLYSFFLPDTPEFQRILARFTPTEQDIFVRKLTDHISDFMDSFMQRGARPAADELQDFMRNLRELVNEEFDARARVMNQTAEVITDVTARTPTEELDPLAGNITGAGPIQPPENIARERVARRMVAGNVAVDTVFAGKEEMAQALGMSRRAINDAIDDGLIIRGPERKGWQLSDDVRRNVQEIRGVPLPEPLPAAPAVEEAYSVERDLGDLGLRPEDLPVDETRSVYDFAPQSYRDAGERRWRTVGDLRRVQNEVNDSIRALQTERATALLTGNLEQIAAIDESIFLGNELNTRLNLFIQAQDSIATRLKKWFFEAYPGPRHFEPGAERQAAWEIFFGRGERLSNQVSDISERMAQQIRGGGGIEAVPDVTLEQAMTDFGYRINFYPDGRIQSFTDIQTQREIFGASEELYEGIGAYQIAQFRRRFGVTVADDFQRPWLDVVQGARPPAAPAPAHDVVEEFTQGVAGGTISLEEGLQMIRDTGLRIDPARRDEFDEMWRLYINQIEPHLSARYGRNSATYEAMMEYLYGRLGSLLLDGVDPRNSRLYDAVVEQILEIYNYGERMARELDSAPDWITPIPPPVHELPPGIRTAIRTGQEMVSQQAASNELLQSIEQHLMGLLERGDPFVASLSGDARRVLEAWDDIAGGVKSDIVDLSKYGPEVSPRLGEVAQGLVRGQSWEGALPFTNRVMLNYSDFSNFDEVMKNAIPFWMFGSRSVPFWLETSILHPEIPAFYQKYLAFSRRSAYGMGATNSAGAQLPRLEGYVPIPGTEMWTNPLSPLSIRFLFPVNRRYDSDPEERTIMQDVAAFLYENGQFFGFSPNPVMLGLLAYETGWLDPHRFPIWGVLPQTDFIPPWFQESIRESLRKVPLVGSVVNRYILPELGFMDYLIEREMLSWGLGQIISNHERATKVAADITLALEQREGNGLWERIKRQVETGDYYRSMAGYFTGLYAKPFTDGEAQLLALRDEVNGLRDAVNLQVGRGIFPLDADILQMYDIYKEFRYNTPEGWINNLYGTIRWTVTPEGVQLTGDERRQLISQRVHEEQVTKHYFEAITEVSSVRDAALAELPIGAPGELRSSVWDGYFQSRRRIEEDPKFSLARRGFVVGYQPLAALEKRYTGLWWQMIRETMPRWKKEEGQTFSEWQIATQMWRNTLPQIGMKLRNAWLFQEFNEVNEQLRARGFDIQAFADQMAENTNIEAWEAFDQQNDTIYDALNKAYSALHLDPYFQISEDKNGREARLAQMEYLREHPRPPSAEELASWVKQKYGDQFPEGELMRRASGPITSIEERLAPSGEEAKVEDEVWDILFAAGIGQQFGAFADAFQNNGGDEFFIDAWYESGGEILNVLNDEARERNLNALQKASRHIGLQEPTIEQVRQQVEAQKLNDQFWQSARGLYGEDIQQMLARVSRMSFSERNDFRHTNPADWLRRSAYFDFRDQFARDNPEWAMFYHAAVFQALQEGKTLAEALASIGIGSGTGGRGGGTGGGILARPPGGLLRPGRRSELDVRRLLYGTRLGSGGVYSPPDWPRWLLERLGKRLAEAAEGLKEGQPLSNTSVTGLKNLQETAPELREPIDDIILFHRMVSGGNAGPKRKI